MITKENLSKIESRKGKTLQKVSKMSDIPFEVRGFIIGICEYIVTGNENELQAAENLIKQYLAKK